MSEREAIARGIIDDLTTKRAGEKTVYTGCLTNCGGNHQCVLKAHVKAGKVVRIEPDDRYNRGIGREDQVLSERDLAQARVQRRCCPMGWVWHKHLNDPNRLLFPLRRRKGSIRGEIDFERIDWSEAVDLLVEKLSESREKHGRYSIMTPFSPNDSIERFFSFWGAGVDGWGWCSCDAERLASHLNVGRLGWEYYGSSSAADMMLNSKLIVLWGFDPTVAHHGPGHLFAWYVKLARERGTPVICIDPRYTMSAEVMADQWIPIKPGTDMAFILAVAYMLFEEDRYNQDFVKRFVEPEGFEKWRSYILGTEDGVAKTPWWAEAICGVPAETIAEFARLYAQSNPTWLWMHWSVARKGRGENSSRGVAALQAMMGYFGVEGGIMPHFIGAWPVQPIVQPPGQPWGSYAVPKVYRSHLWAQAVLLLDQVRNGEMTGDEWRRRVGYRAEAELPIPEAFNPNLLWWGGGREGIASNQLVTGCDSSNDQIKAMQRFGFVVTMHTAMTPSARYSDLILPSIDPMWEQVKVLQSDPSGYGGLSTVSCAPGVVPAPGETRSSPWLLAKLASRMGFGKAFNRYYTDDDSWEVDWERYQRESYENWAKTLEFETPLWEDFRSGKFIHMDEHHDRPFVGFTAEIQDGEPFKTNSGQFEIFSELIADESQRGRLHYDHAGRLIDNLPNDWRDLKALPEYQPAPRGLENGLAARFPLMMLTSHSRYRVHSLFWTVPWLNGDVYRHGVWLNVADAKRRGITDGDRVRVFNERGEIVLPAYVTNRVMPGVTLVRQGAWYVAGDGITSQVLLGDPDSPVTPAPAATLVEIQKIAGQKEER